MIVIEKILNNVAKLFSLVANNIGLLAPSCDLTFPRFLCFIHRFPRGGATPTNNVMVMDKLKAILVGFGIPEDTIREDTLIHAHLGLDSVEIVKLALELKRGFNLDLKLSTRNDLTLAEICQMAESAVPTQSL